MRASSAAISRIAALVFSLNATVVFAVPFTISITNTGNDPWGTGLITLSPLVSLGLTPQPASPSYSTYVYANSHCKVNDAICGTTCTEDGNAQVLVTRLGLTVGTNAWYVPALAAGDTESIQIDVPQGASISFISWINNTGNFDDFVAMHVPGNQSNMSIALFAANGTPLASPTFALSGYDMNSTSATNGSGATCTQECPTQTTGCFVAPGNASMGFPGTYPAQPNLSPQMALTATGPATATSGSNQTYTFTWRNNHGSNAQQSTLTYTLPPGVVFVSATNGGTQANGVITWNLGNLNANNTGSRSVTVTLPALGNTTAHAAQLSYRNGGRNYVVASNTITTVCAPTTLTSTWVYTEPNGRMTDGLAIGNLTGVTGSELIVVSPTRGSIDGGAAIVLRTDTGAEVARYQPGVGRNAQGVPLVENLDGTGNFEFLFGEANSVTSNAALFARNGDATARWASLPYGYPGYWNMGPASANVTASAGQEVVLADWDGNVRLLSSTGAVLASYSSWATDGDNAFGTPAIADVDGDGTLEVVLFGYTKGLVTVLNADTLTAQWKSASLKTLTGDGAYGSSPAVGDLDGDGRAEIVVATYGTTNDVFAFDVTMPTGSSCKYRFDTGGRHAYLSPVIGDVDGTGRKSVVVISSTDGVVSVMKANGAGCNAAASTMVWQYTIKAGENSVFTPMLYDVNGDGTLDVIAASRTRVVILDVRNRRVLAQFEDATATFSPSGAVANADTASAQRELYVTGWRNGKVYRIALPASATSTTDWPTFMGSNTRTGSR
ncbi:MAG: FG-GAP-like repeat-containing protein [Archangium sp.]